MSTAVVKREPKSVGIATPRKKRPKEIAVITECCTGCAGSPACVAYCPVEVDPALCIGCKKCVSQGPGGAFLDGCPWDAIEMVATEQVEAMAGVKMPV
jgi:ferredoxin